MKKKFLVSGNTNIETTLAINEFPIEYSPIKFSFKGVKTTISGGGINLAFSLKTLGGEVNFLSMIGKNYLDKWVIEVLKEKGIGSDLLLECLDEIPNSVILYDEQGRRQINIDPKNLQEQTIPKNIM
jgi:ribokinase